MRIDLTSLSPHECYKLLTSLVVPRPIALVTSVSAQGVVNAAPFSFFNCLGADPPLLALSIGDRAPGVPKDTARNIRATREFVVNLVDEAIAEAMNTCAADFPESMSELEPAGLTAAESMHVRPPRLAEAPAAFECVETQTIEIGGNRIVLGRVLCAHVRDGLIDPKTRRVDGAALRLIGRMEAPGWYCTTRDRFEMPRMGYEQWKARQRG